MQSIAIICNQLQSYAYAINCNVFHRMQIPGAASQGLAKRNSLAWSSRRGVSKSLCRRRPLWGQPDSIRDWAMDAGARRISTPTVPNLNPLRTLQRFEMVWNGLRWFENVWNDLKKRWFEEARNQKSERWTQHVTAGHSYKTLQICVVQTRYAILPENPKQSKTWRSRWPCHAETHWKASSILIALSASNHLGTRSIWMDLASIE